MTTLVLLADLNLSGGTPRKILMLGHCQDEMPLAVLAWSSNYADNKARFESAGIPVFMLQKQSLLACLSLIGRLSKAKRISGIHCHFTFGFMVGALAKLIYPRLRVTAGLVSNLCQQGIKGVIESWALRQMDALAYVSEYVRRAYESRYPRLRTSRGTVIFNAAEPRDTSGVVPVPEGVPVLLAVSGLNEHKNVGLLVEVARRLKQRRGDAFRLLIIGDGPQRGHIAQQIEACGVSDSVQLLGYRDDVGSFLARSQLFLHPATNEGFGIAVAEAMLAGLPVMAARCGGLPELVEDGRTGYLLPPDDAEAWAELIGRLLEDGSVRAALGKAGASRARDLFALERYCAAYQALFSGHERTKT